MDGSIADYIRANRGQYTREAITQQLEAAGYERQAIDAGWDGVAMEEPAGGGETRNLALYVWILYWLGAAIISAITAISLIGSGGGPGFTTFGIGWLIAYLALTYLPARALARARPSGAASTVLLIVAVPAVVLLIGGGICLGTIGIIVWALGS